MPKQTTKTVNITFPDGAKMQVQTPSDPSYFDVGALSGSITMTLNYDVNRFLTANAGPTPTQIKNMTVAGSATLINIDPEAVEKMGGGMFERVTTAGTSVTGIDNQVIAANAASDLTPYEIKLVETATGQQLRVDSALVITSVTGATDGLLVEGDDYYIINDSSSYSGKAIVFDLSGAALTTLDQAITIVYASVTPVASTTTYAGNTTEILEAYALKFTHTDDNGKIRQVELFAVNPDSGGFQFNFKGAEEDGVEEMPLTFTGEIDTARTNGRQLMAWTVDEGAQ